MNKVVLFSAITIGLATSLSACSNEGSGTRLADSGIRMDTEATVSDATSSTEDGEIDSGADSSPLNTGFWGKGSGED